MILTIVDKVILIIVNHRFIINKNVNSLFLMYTILQFQRIINNDINIINRLIYSSLNILKFL